MIPAEKSGRRWTPEGVAETDSCDTLAISIGIKERMILGWGTGNAEQSRNSYKRIPAMGNFEIVRWNYQNHPMEFLHLSSIILDPSKLVDYTYNDKITFSEQEKLFYRIKENVLFQKIERKICGTRLLGLGYS